MALALTPLDPASLSEAARRAVTAPDAARLVAARGLAPVTRPADMACVLYQLSLDSDDKVRAAALAAAVELPDKILVPAMVDPSLDPRVLDFFSGKCPARAAVLEAVLLNRRTADETIVELAGKVGERQVEMIAANEQRLLRAPAIIAALYLNPRSRMSTVDRAVELAARSNVVVPGIPGWDEVVEAVTGATRGTGAQPDVDSAFAAAVAVGVGDVGVLEEAADDFLDEGPVASLEATKKRSVPIERLPIHAKIRLAMLGNAFARSVLIRDPNRQVAIAAIRSAGVTDNEVVKFSANRSLSDDVVRVIANNKDWTKIYQVKANLVNNPKTPLPLAMRLLTFLHEKDLRAVARSKGIPSPLVQQAQRLVSAKQGGGK